MYIFIDSQAAIKRLQLNALTGGQELVFKIVDLISGGWEDDRVNDIAKQVKQVIRWSGEQVKQVKVDELDMIDNDYLRGIDSLYTWKILVPERLRSGSLLYTRVIYYLMH